MICDFCNQETTQARLVLGEPNRYKCKRCQTAPKPSAPTIRIGPYSSPYNRDKD
jgi:hypothetical protein